MAQLAKNLPAVGEIWIQSLGREDPLAKAKAINSSILAWRIPYSTLLLPHAVSAGPLPRSPLQIPSSSTQPLSTLTDTYLRLEIAGLWHGTSVDLTLACLPQTLVASLSSDSP